jgi:hypothetical protein
MKPFHFHTPYFKIGPFRIQLTLIHLNGPTWTGEESNLKNTFVWIPIIYRYEQQFCGFITTSRGIIFGKIGLSIDLCDVRNQLTS